MPHSADYDLVCIGSGPAGQRAAIQAAKLGKRVAVVEKQRSVGGLCIDTGTIPSKTFREAVRRVYSRPGLEAGEAPYRERVRPTMQQLVGHVARVIQREAGMVHDVLARNDIRLVHGRASFEDPHTLVVESTDGRRRLTAAHILIAVGTTPSTPRGVEFDHRTITTSDTVLGLEQLPRTMVVVGAGVIGIEYASMFAALGVQVTVIDQRPRPLEFLDHEIVDELIHQMRKSDVVFRCGDAVRADRSRRRRGAASGSAPSGVGQASRRRRRAVLGRENRRHGGPQPRGGRAEGRRSRTAAGRRALPDRRSDTSAAAGDVIGFPALAATSSEQGRLAACWMFGVDAKPMGNHFPVGIYAIPEVSMAGATEEELTEQKIPYETGIARYKEISRGSIRGDDSGMFKMLFHREDGRLLGCHCIGSGATELIHVGQAVLALGGGLDYFLTTVFNYPTLAECYKVAAHNAANKLALVRRVSSLSAGVIPA